MTGEPEIKLTVSLTAAELRALTNAVFVETSALSPAERNLADSALKKVASAARRRASKV